MSDEQRSGQQSQQSAEPGSRSPEYSDNLTNQDRDKGLTNKDEGGLEGEGGLTGTGTTVGMGDQSAGARPAGFGASESATTGGSTTGSSTTGYSANPTGDNIDGAGRDRTGDVTSDETNTLISADKVQGTPVYDASGERLGTIDSLMLNKRSGKVAYAVMSFGGFLGIGERYHPLPWDVLTYDVDKGGYNVGHTADQIRTAPNYSRDEIDEGDFSSRGREVDDYYGRGANSSLTMPTAGLGTPGTTLA